METIKDLWASLVAYANERSTNPLTSAFFLTWAAWNYKFFVLLFSDLDPVDKFNEIEALYPKPESLYGNALLFPLLTTLFYVFAYPYITRKVVSFYRRQQVVIANELKKVENERVRTVEEVNALVRRYEGRLTAAEQEALAAENEINGLRNALTETESQIKELRNAIPAPTFVNADEGDIANPAPTPQEIKGVGLQKVFTWTIQNTDGGISKQSLTESQARILHLVKKYVPRSSSQIGDLLGMLVDDVNADIRVLVQNGALSRTAGVFDLTDWGRTMLDVVNAKGEIDVLNAGVEKVSDGTLFDNALERNLRTPRSDLKI